MSKPMAICIEDLDPAPGAPRFVRCTALVGLASGLRLDERGAVLWESGGAVACHICVTLDDHLGMYRPDDAPEVTVRRAGRSLKVPIGKPVILVDRDEVDTCGRSYRVHVHGTAASVHAPEAFEPPQPSAIGPVSRAAAAAVIGGTVLAGAGCSNSDPETVPPPPPPPVEVRDMPPVVMPPINPTPPPPPAPEPGAPAQE